MPNPKNSVSTVFPKYFLLITLALGLVWAKSSYGKLTGGVFVSNLGKTLAMFASKNPHAWYKNFLNTVAIPNSTMFGQLTMWGELLIAISITAASLLLIIKIDNKLIKIIFVLGLLGSVFLNATFWLASGWTSASTDSLNLLMATIEAIAAAAVLQSALNS